MHKPGRRWIWVLVGILLSWGATGLIYAATPGLKLPHHQTSPADTSTSAPMTDAFTAAIAAATLAGSATEADEWNAVAAGWAAAIQSLQTLSPENPQWIFAQRKAREYLANQGIAQQRAEAAGMPVVFPTLGSEVLDEQLGVYLSYIATLGPPDIMVIGSSRALQGVNPQILQQRLTQQGVESARVYTFAVNGATAQVVSFILRQLLTAEQMPRLIIWAGGSRSFNSARVDRTFASIAASPGYTALATGKRPSLNWNDSSEANGNAPATPIPVTKIDGYGFLPVADVFDPEQYYQTFPRVSGRYDAAYQPFDLTGVQTASLRAIAAFTQTQTIPLIFVNLPLSGDYLDATRLGYEQQFQRYLQQEARQGDFIVMDLLQQWSAQNQFFADPSHLNQAGATQIAIQLAASSTIPWEQLTPSPSAAPTAP